MSKSLIFITGTRADFGKLKPIINISRDQGYDVSIIVTGMHMLDEFGSTREEVKKIQGTTIYEFINQRAHDSLNTILTKSVTAFSDYFVGLDPDLVVVHGDRIEAFAAVIAATLNNFRVAHLEGGEVSGTIDESLRHSCSKLSTVHFCCSNSASKRLLALGENPERVFNIGSSDLDGHLISSSISCSEAKDYYEIPFDEFGLFSFHPVFSEQQELQEHIKIICNKMLDSGRHFVGIYPNNDPGYDLIMNEVLKLPSSQFKFFPSMRFEYFSTLMRNSKIFIGNSSAIVREAPFFGIQSINIGTRQNNRAMSQSIQNISYEQLDSLDKIIDKYWGIVYSESYEFGDGQSAKKFINAIKSDDFWHIPLQKSFYD